MIHFVITWWRSEFLLAMRKYDSLEINTAGICVTLEITRTFTGSWNWYLRRFEQKNIMYTIEEDILNALVCSAPNLQKLEIRHFGNKPFNYLHCSYYGNKFFVQSHLYIRHGNRRLSLAALPGLPAASRGIKSDAARRHSLCFSVTVIPVILWTRLSM